IEDGVDVISYSLGGGSSTFDEDPLYVGAFSAMRKGIFVSTSAGNEGPHSATLSNEAPWVLTTGASSTDRDLNITKVEKGQTVKDAGGAAMILINAKVDGYTTEAETHVLPTSHVSYVDGKKILAYLNSTSNATATVVFRGTVIGDKKAPAVSQFSARGPSIASPGILKPDIIGPGSGILAAWPNSMEKTKAQSTFNILWTSMAAVLTLSGVAALTQKFTS
ncbi:hypothetical protein Leryth_022319, partial [Lithospermum erythrorhizon]